MKIRNLLIISMIIFALFSMILFTVIISVSMSSSAESRYKEMVTEMSVKQAQIIEQLFDSYNQRLLRIMKTPAITEYMRLLEEATKAANDIPAEAIPAEAIPAEITPLSGGITEEEGSSVADEEDKYEEAYRVISALIHEGSVVTGITVFNGNNEIVLSVGNEHGDFITSGRRQNLKEGHFTTVLAQQGSAQVGGSSAYDFELLKYVQISESHFVVCTYNSSDIEMIIERSMLPPANFGKLVLRCPMDNFIDKKLVGNLRGALPEGIPKVSGQEYANMTVPIVREYEQYLDGEKFFPYDVGRNSYHALFTDVGETGWLLGVIARDADMHEHSKKTMTSLLNCALFLGAAMVVLAVFFALWFTKPFIVIKDTLTKVRRGDHELRINIKSLNEYGNISKEFNALLDNVVVGEGRYKTVVEMSNNIIFEWNFQTGNVHFSNNFGKKFSYRAPSDSYEDSFLNKCKVHPEDTEPYKKTLEKLAAGESIQQDEFRWKNIFGDYIWVLMRSCPVHGVNDEIVKVVGVIIDIDRAKKSEKILSARASYDALTGLYNRETLENLINNEIDLITARKNEFSILFIDVDDFKFFNDNYSHATGDQVLRFTAISINDIVSKYGMAGRFGGDEFVVCVRNSEINDPAKTAEEILERLKEGFVCDVGDRLSVNVSIGIAIIRDTTKRVDEIIGMADDAMYKIKKSGKSNYGFIN
ncbi:MAG: diguanylate cyclase [Oscillospiraceae bacterium]|nr:diguanylate cyclase [Oscillospiraceae bacterium]